MEEYKAYLIGPNGLIVSRIDLMCEDENTAVVEQALQLAGDCAVELWYGDRKITEFPAHQ
jgi:hypothetical protein